jgi:hypothetical protein
MELAHFVAAGKHATLGSDDCANKADFERAVFDMTGAFVVRQARDCSREADNISATVSGGQPPARSL